jgi:peptidyl-Lys metalloendopeptidase
MKFLSLWIATAALLLAGTAATAASRDGLAVRLSVPAPVLRGDVDVVVNVSVTNTTRQAITLLRWELPTERHEGAAFRILLDGKPVTYTGVLIKRGTPTRDDYVRIEPGATLSYDVELTAAYDLSRNGTYTIEYVGKGGGAESAALRSEAMYLWLEARSERAPAAPETQINPTPQAASITYTGNCSASRQTTLANAVAAATTYASNAQTYLNRTPAATQRYTKWFGALTTARWNTAKSHYTNIYNAFATQALVLDCSCTQSYYAYVYPTQPYKIYVCNAFWSAPMTGTDSKAGTLVHEMSHFNVVAGTDDWAYGQSAAASLAISNPTRALDNADSHEYFAENTPSLP